MRRDNIKGTRVRGGSNRNDYRKQQEKRMELSGLKGATVKGSRE